MCWSISAAAQTSLNDQDPLSHRHGSRVTANNSSPLVASYDMQGIHRAYSNPGHFCQQRRLHTDQVLKLYKVIIPVVPQAKFLGVIFDKKLNFKAHIDYLREKCQKSLNLLKVVSKLDWGTDTTVLLKLYRALVRSKLDYSCVVYSSARNS